jgi:hypothetical protein
MRKDLDVHTRIEVFSEAPGARTIPCRPERSGRLKLLLLQPSSHEQRDSFFVSGSQDFFVDHSPDMYEATITSVG